MQRKKRDSWDPEPIEYEKTERLNVLLEEIKSHYSEDSLDYRQYWEVDDLIHQLNSKKLLGYELEESKTVLETAITDLAYYLASTPYIMNSKTMKWNLPLNLDHLTRGSLVFHGNIKTIRTYPSIVSSQIVPDGYIIINGNITEGANFKGKNVHIKGDVKGNLKVEAGKVFVDGDVDVCQMSIDKRAFLFVKGNVIVRQFEKCSKGGLYVGDFGQLFIYKTLLTMFVPRVHKKTFISWERASNYIYAKGKVKLIESYGQKRQRVIKTRSYNNQTLKTNRKQMPKFDSELRKFIPKIPNRIGLDHSFYTRKPEMIVFQPRDNGKESPSQLAEFSPITTSETFFCQLDNEQHPSTDPAYKCGHCSRQICGACYDDILRTSFSICPYCKGKLKKG